MNIFRLLIYNVKYVELIAKDLWHAKTEYTYSGHECKILFAGNRREVVNIAPVIVVHTQIGFQKLCWKNDEYKYYIVILLIRIVRRQLKQKNQFDWTEDPKMKCRWSVAK